MTNSIPDTTISAATDLTGLFGPILDPNDASVKKGRVLISMNASGSLSMRDDPSAPAGWSEKFAIYWNGESFLAIRSKSIVELVLTGPTTWEFDIQKGLLKFKNAIHDNWYNITYSHGQKPIKNILLHAIPSGQKPDTEAARHGFNLMIKIGQIGPDGQPGRPLPVTIDPDAKNPPPIGSMFDPQSPPVPVLSLTA